MRKQWNHCLDYLVIMYSREVLQMLDYFNVHDTGRNGLEALTALVLVLGKKVIDQEKTIVNLQQQLTDAKVKKATLQLIQNLIRVVP